MTSVLIYTRLSTDDQHGSTERQAAACRAYAAARDWAVADVLTDVDASAYQDTPRPAFDSLVEDCEVRSADGILILEARSAGTPSGGLRAAVGGR